MEVVSKILRRIFRKYWRHITVSPAPTIGEEERKLIRKLKSESSQSVKSEKIREFEEAFAKYNNVKHAVSFCKARVGLYAVLKLLNIRKDDEILVVAGNCIVVPNTIIFAGANPIYVDLEKDSFNPSIKDMKKKITRRTKAVIVPHLFGEAVDISGILKHAKKNNIVIIEDCAQSLGAMYDVNENKKIGTQGDFAIFSFDYSKNMTTGQGGMVVVKNKEQYHVLLKLRERFSVPSDNYVDSTFNVLLKARLLEPHLHAVGEPAYIISHMINNGYRYFHKDNYKNQLHASIGSDEMETREPKNFLKKFSDKQAVLGLQQLNILNELNNKRIKIAQKYNEEFKKIGIKIPLPQKNTKHVYLRYVLEVDTDKVQREKVLELFSKHQVELGLWFDFPIFPKPKDITKIRYSEGSCPHAELKSRRIINLPNHPKMTDHDIERVINLVKRHKNYFIKINDATAL